jgi:hypothetical protein
VISGVKPQQVLILNDETPLVPSEFPYVSDFPRTGVFDFQILEDHITAWSISMYQPVTFVFVSLIFVKEQKIPIWLPDNLTCGELCLRLPKIIRELRLDNKMSLLVSRGMKSKIVKPRTETSRLRSEEIRIDVLRYELPKNKWRLRALITSRSPISVEVRYAKSRGVDNFEGVSCVLGITKDSKMRDVANQMTTFRRSFLAKGANLVAFFFASEKPKIHVSVDLNANIYEELEKFLDELTAPKQRVCIGLMVRDPLIVLRIKKRPPDRMINQSLSVVLNSRMRVGRSEPDLTALAGG